MGIITKSQPLRAQYGSTLLLLCLVEMATNEDLDHHHQFTPAARPHSAHAGSCARTCGHDHFGDAAGRGTDVEGYLSYVSLLKKNTTRKSLSELGFGPVRYPWNRSGKVAGGNEKGQWIRVSDSDVTRRRPSSNCTQLQNI
jgi:hypothetical protein